MVLGHGVLLMSQVVDKEKTVLKLSLLLRVQMISVAHLQGPSFVRVSMKHLTQKFAFIVNCKFFISLNRGRIVHGLLII